MHMLEPYILTNVQLQHQTISGDNNIVLLTQAPLDTQFR